MSVLHIIGLIARVAHPSMEPAAYDFSVVSVVASEIKRLSRDVKISAATISQIMSSIFRLLGEQGIRSGCKESRVLLVELEPCPLFFVKEIEVLLVDQNEARGLTMMSPSRFRPEPTSGEWMGQWVEWVGFTPLFKSQPGNLDSLS